LAATISVQFPDRNGEKALTRKRRAGPRQFASPAVATLTYFGFYSFPILALSSGENKPRPILDGTLGALGAASYILYLIHLPLFYCVSNKLLLLPAVHQSLTSQTALMLSVLVAVAISISLHCGIERPTLHWLRRRLLLHSSRPGRERQPESDSLNAAAALPG
jgi:peptidoglycan/LPS O-acetylase OafA/YrhL